MPNITALGKALILLGVLLVILGTFIVAGKEIPGFSRLGKLPGDIRIEKEGFSFYFPLTTCILVSGIMTLLSVIFRWLTHR